MDSQTLSKKDLLPTGAQIPLQSFQLPVFPPEAYAIPPSLPPGIESLTLELFLLGYAAPFQSQLPNLRSLTGYSQLIDGTTTTTKNGGLKELHLDAFCRKGFMSGIGAILEYLHRMNNPDDTEKEEGDVPKLRFLEISYTDELPAMLGPSVMAVLFSLNAPPSVNPATGDNGDLPHDPADMDEEEGNPIPGKKPEGVIPLLNSNAGTEVLVRKLTVGEVGSTSKGGNQDEQELSFSPVSGSGPATLKLLKSTLYTLDTAGANGSGGAELEIVEVVGVPNDQFDKEVSSSSTSSDPQELSSRFWKKCFQSFRMTILRVTSFGYVEWNRAEGISDGITPSLACQVSAFSNEAIPETLVLTTPAL
ncbi:hypothetical protein PAAG_07461 [Paracoccidioides lutzii Pb01]|uniref:Uncharacterized protein n=1 Tax=Paracoccidioides lutzii (strain ATCC MYA-826 / Pb01) TaxID=502779 RepID=C1H9M0_PARBA|nr:hypothetical protein PAAG_07461 [Paracoccidioides lutzii Pb01]EEH37043.2 hypothetical protein PAAG_07461 [Paracoccidioides lutzii Pb01]